MAEPIKLSEKELNELNNIQVKFQEKVVQFGQLYLDNMILEEKRKALFDHEDSLKKEMEEIKNLEKQWIDSIASKYGNGNLSLKDGTFTPV